MVKWASWPESGLVQGTRAERTGGGDGADGTMKEIYQRGEEITNIRNN